jgi:hypothetical protein
MAAIILKAPQKREIANYGLAMHYDAKTNITTALLYGTDVLVCNSGAALAAQHPNPHPPVGDRIFTYIHNIRDGHKQCARLQIATIIQSAPEAWKQPLFLPCVLLQDHMDRTHQYCEHGQVSTEMWDIMNGLGSLSSIRNERSR